MFKFVNKLSNLLKPASEQQRLEAYIARANPTTIAEVERLTKEFDRSESAKFSAKLGAM